MTKKALKVLLVEDSEDDARLAIRVLRSAGFDPSYRRVQDAATLRAVIDAEPWDAVLSDFRLPSFSGVEALRIFRESGLDIPFIFVSGTIGEETAVEAMKAGASDYVMKQNLARLAPALERELGQAVIRAQHRQAQVDLELTRDRYVDLYDFAPVGYLTVSSEGEIVQLNLTAADMLGDIRAELLYTPLARFAAQAHAGLWDQQFRHVLASGEKQSLELELRRADGTPFHAHLDCVRVAGPVVGHAPMVRIAMTDISERKEAEADMHRFEAQLRHIQKMESVGTLAGGIAHDFNNILGGILGNVALAREQLGDAHAALGYLDEIHKASSRARTLVRQILTFSRREPQELLTQPLRPIVEETHKLLRATLPTRVELGVALPDEPLSVHADATQIQQVLMNLCTNAWHALADGAGHIRIGLEPVHFGELLPAPAGLEAGRHAHLWVSDDGCGMDASTRERIFEPFFTTKPVGQGTGLGLSVVHGILAAHHGAIRVDSEPGRGSTFHLFLPAVAEDAAAPIEAHPTQATPARGRGERVLYIDDDATMVIMVESLLQRWGYRVTSLQDAPAAIEAVRREPLGFDLVVTDFNMPECSGLDVAQALAGIRPDLPIVISSGYITDELRARAREVGVRGLLEKQNTFEELGGLVGRVLAGTAGGAA